MGLHRMTSKPSDRRTLWRLAFLRPELPGVVDAGRPGSGALSRQFGHGNFRLGGDPLLRNFLNGLTLRLRGAG